MRADKIAGSPIILPLTLYVDCSNLDCCKRAPRLSNEKQAHECERDKQGDDRKHVAHDVLSCRNCDFYQYVLVEDHEAIGLRIDAGSIASSRLLES